MTAPRREKGSSNSRVLEIIEAVSRAERPLSPADLSIHLDIPRPSIHRLLQQLEADSYLQTDARGFMVPGERLHNIAIGLVHNSRHKAERRAILESLANKIGETCGIAIPDGTEMIYFDRVQCNWPLQIYLPIGSRTPVWCTASGKLYLSSLPKEQRKRIINNLRLEQRARNTLSNVEALEMSMRDIHENQMGIDNEEFIDGMVACAVPVKDKDGKLFACLFCHAPVIRKSLEQIKSFKPELDKAAIQLQEMISEPD
ncbi:MAG: IclR family transcriptional regulator [Moraxellaceae bacterium]|nr:MAG: IclR family transcriptional regulator [Moraxellaceae bacterium]